MNPNLKRKYQIIIGFAIFAFAVSVSYFSVVEADVQDTPKYDIYLVIDVSGSMGTCGQPLNPDMTCEQIIITDDSPIVFAKQAAIEFVDAFQSSQSSDHRIGLISFSDYAQMLVKLDDNSKNLREGVELKNPPSI